MSDNLIIFNINQSRSLSRKFHRLEMDERRKVVEALAEGELNEKRVIKIIRKVKKGN